MTNVNEAKPCKLLFYCNDIKMFKNCLQTWMANKNYYFSSIADGTLVVGRESNFQTALAAPIIAPLISAYFLSIASNVGWYHPSADGDERIWFHNLVMSVSISLLLVGFCATIPVPRNNLCETKLFNRCWYHMRFYDSSYMHVSLYYITSTLL